MPSSSPYLSGPVQVTAQGVHSSSSDKLHNLGETVFANDGRAYKYCLAGASALVAGNLQQSSVQDTSEHDLTAVAAAVGDLVIATSESLTIDANEYAEGWAVISVTPGVGRIYKVKGHAAFSAAAATFNLFEPIEVALTTTSRFDMVHNPYWKVIINPTTQTRAPIGVAVHPVAASEYGWLQVAGITCVEFEGAGTVGLPVVASDTDNGTVETIADGAHELLTVVGTAYTTVADGEMGAVLLHGLL